MTIIYKYAIDLGRVAVQMPKGAEVLHAGVQGNLGPSGLSGLFVWAMVDTSQPPEPREFVAVGTGHPMEASGQVGRHISTVIDGPYVWHVFEGERA